MKAIRAPKTWGASLGAVLPYPAWKALARPIDGIARPVLGALAELSTVLPIFSTGTHLVAERAEESWQAVAVPGHVVTGTAAVHALRAWLAAVVSIEARGANSLAQGSSVARCTVTGAVLRSTGSPVLTATGDGAVRSPAALGAHIVTVDACPASKAAAVTGDGIAPICVVTVTAFTAIKTICSIRARLVTVVPLPARGAQTEAISRPAGCSICAVTRLVTVKTPTST